jgi:hypothetical protein
LKTQIQQPLRKKKLNLIKLVSIFLNLYPSYTFQDVKNEYAITFFTLLNEGYHLRYQHYLMLSQISALPYMEEADQRNFIDSLVMVTEKKDDIINEEVIEKNKQKLKEFLNG